MRFAIAVAASSLGLPNTGSAQTRTVGMQGEPGTLDPQYNLPGTNPCALRSVHDTLISRDPALQLWAGRADRVRFTPRADDGTLAVEIQAAP